MAGTEGASVALAAIARLDAWLRENAPTAHAALRPPASQADLAAAEEAVGRQLPADLRASWNDADGAHPALQKGGGSLIPPHFVPYPVAEALNSRRIWMDVARQVAPIPVAELEAFIAAQNEQPAGTGCETWLPAWLPIATDRGAGNLFVDLRDGPNHGCVMEYYQGHRDRQGSSVGRRRGDAARHCRSAR